MFLPALGSELSSTWVGARLSSARDRCSARLRARLSARDSMTRVDLARGPAQLET